jgi:hypothetical protein
VGGRDRNPHSGGADTLDTVFDHLYHRVGDGGPTTKNALKLNAAENQGAQRAGRARVATTVATEFAASWKRW